MKPLFEVEKMIGTCGVSPERDNVERILEVCQELLMHVRKLEGKVYDVERRGDSCD